MTPATFADLLDRAYVDMRPWSANEVAATLSSSHIVFLTRDNGGLIARIVAGECEILALATDPDAQRQGVASSLMAELIDRAERSSADTVFLDVASRNIPARRFYEAMGFARIGSRRDYYTLRDGSKDDALLMSRAVPGGNSGATPTSHGPATKSG